MRIFRNEVFEASDGENGIRLVEVRQAEYDALVAERDRYRAALRCIDQITDDDDVLGFVQVALSPVDEAAS